MTFTELLAMVRREIIVDDYGDAYVDADIEDVLWKASVEIAAAFDMPRTIATQAIPLNAAAVTLLEGGTTAPVARVHSVSVVGDDAVAASLQQVIRMRAVSPGPIRYFNFDPRRAGGEIQIAPLSYGGDMTVEYTVQLARPTPFGSANPWLNALPQFHSLVAYRAGVALYEMAERENETEHWRAQYDARAAELAAMLGNTNIGTLMMTQTQGGQ